MGCTLEFRHSTLGQPMECKRSGLVLSLETYFKCFTEIYYNTLLHYYNNINNIEQIGSYYRYTGNKH